MGYYTSYSLTVSDYDEDAVAPEAIIAALRTNDSDAEWAINNDGSPSGSESKWYSHNPELVAFSYNYPGVLFTLSGAGEEAGDLWKLYVRDGKAQEAPAIITYPPCEI